MTAEKLEAGNETLQAQFQAQFPDWKGPAWHYGYEMTNAVGLSFPPYILIQVSDTGGSPEPRAVRHDLLTNVPPEIQVDGPIFDQRLNAFLATYDLRIPNAPALEVSVGYFLIRRGVIKVFAFYPPDDSKELVSAIRQFLGSVKISERAKLKPSNPSSRTGLILALMAIVAIVVMLSRARTAKPT